MACLKSSAELDSARVRRGVAFVDESRNSLFGSGVAAGAKTLRIVFDGMDGSNRGPGLVLSDDVRKMLRASS